MIEKLKITAKGITMGAADIVPGVSGGTIALLTGIYPQLINAITGLNIHSIKQISKGDFKGFWTSIDGSFVLPLLIGIGLAFALLAHPIKHAIENHPIPTWSFFFGLIIASALLIIQHIPNKKTSSFLWLIPGIAFGYWIGSIGDIPFPSNHLAVFIAGMIAICAMILPGISGSFILVLLGMYEILISAVAERNLAILSVFVAGAFIGLILFSRIIKFALSKFYQPTLFFLSGLMLGSLVKVWPWKLTEFNSVLNVMPYEHSHPQTLLAISLMATAFILVFVVDTIGGKLSSK